MLAKYDPVDIARQFLFIREAATQNTGQRVEAIQKWCGGSVGESYCCYFVTMCLDIAYQGNAPIERMGACENVYVLAKRNLWLTSKPSVGDLYLYVNSKDQAHHIGFVTKLKPLIGIAGNTSPDGSSSNGNGVFEHVISSTIFVAYPR